MIPFWVDLAWFFICFILFYVWEGLRPKPKPFKRIRIPLCRRIYPTLSYSNDELDHEVYM